MDSTTDICGSCVSAVKVDSERAARLARRNGTQPAQHAWVTVTAANACDVLDAETHYRSTSNTFEAICDVCGLVDLTITPDARPETAIAV